VTRFDDLAGTERLGRVRVLAACQRCADPGEARQRRAERQAEARAEQVAAMGAALVSCRHRCLLTRFDYGIGSGPMPSVFDFASPFSESR
jgi:hypothetical protein